MKRARVPRIKKAKPRPSEAEKLAGVILPFGQARPGVFEAIDISNHSEADQRKMMRSGERRTIRRKPKLEELYNRGLIGRYELSVCEWYAQAHALRYDTLGITAKWGGTTSAACTNFDHLPKTRAQEEAYRLFDYARSGISQFILPLFEAVVLNGAPVGNRSLAFKVAVEQLLQRIDGRVNL